MLLIVGIGTLILSIIGFYNGYPLVYPDTGTYILSGIERYVPVDRPIMYGLFIQLFSFEYSLWSVVFFQNLITAYVLFELMMIFFDEQFNIKRIYLLSLIFLVFSTGIGWYSNQIMPDFLAPISIMVYFILLYRKSIPLTSKIILILILLFSLISHFSHLFLGLALVVISVITKLLMKDRIKEIAFRRIWFLATIILSALIIIPTINFFIEKKFTLSKGSHVFLMGHLVDTGILEQFLKENCTKPEFEYCKICYFKDSLPNDASSFIWTSGIPEKTGGWEGSKQEYNKIINATLMQPKYLCANIYKSVSYGLIQLTDNEIGQGLSAYNEGSPPYGPIYDLFHNELSNYINARQNKWNGLNLSFDSLNIFQSILIIITLFIITLLFSGSIRLKIDRLTLYFLIFVIISIILNSMITAGLNTPYGRMQARVIWLLPLATIIVLIKNNNIFIKTVINNLRKFNQNNT